MQVVQKSARTVEEAVDLALADLGLPRERVVIEVLEEGSKGLFGLIGSRNAVIRATPMQTRAEAAEAWLLEVCRTMGVTDARVSVRQTDDHLLADVSGQEAGMLIGHHGQTLDALQFLANLAVSKEHGDHSRVIVDVEGYRQRREETLQRLAERAAERVRRTGQPQVLEPMSASERRVVHLTLQDHPDVETTSEGDEPQRRVVVQPRR